MGSLCPSRASGCINETGKCDQCFFFSLFFQRYPSRWRCLPASPWLTVQERAGPAYVMAKKRGARHRTITSLEVVVGVTVLFPILFAFRRKSSNRQERENSLSLPPSEQCAASQIFNQLSINSCLPRPRNKVVTVSPSCSLSQKTVKTQLSSLFSVITDISENRPGRAKHKVFNTRGLFVFNWDEDVPRERTVPLPFLSSSAHRMQ